MDQFYAQYKDKLKENYPGINPSNFQSFLDRYQNQSGSNLSYLNETVQMLKESLIAGIPLSYLLKSHYFYNHEMYVDESVLIPRFETEFLVSEALSFIEKSPEEDIRIADVCTGSGCIINAIQIESKKSLSGVAIDIDSNAIKVAEYNNFLIGQLKQKNHKIRFLKGDRMECVQDKKFNLILSNPPYIKRSQKETTVHKNVHSYEPHVALYLEDEFYMEWFDLFFHQVNNCLLPGGLFIMEGDSRHLEVLIDRLERTSLLKGKVKLKKDLAERTRYLIFYKG